jgi:hypothetical protein
MSFEHNFYAFNPGLPNRCLEVCSRLVVGREVLGSNLGLDTDYPDDVLVFLSRQENSKTVPRLGYDRFLPNPFQFITRHIIQRYIVSTLTASLNNHPLSFCYSPRHREHRVKLGGNGFVISPYTRIIIIIIIIIKVKLSVQQAVEANRVVRRRGCHIF